MYSIRRLLSLHLYQAEALISNSRKYNFSDKQKDFYLSNIEKLFNAIKQSIETGVEDVKIFEKKTHLDFIFKSLEFLKDSTLNTIPFEVVGCLNKAMSDWIDSTKFIIVTSLQNSLYSFSYDLSYAKNDLFYQSLETEYEIKFEQKLVQINLPITLSKDYLSSVALYHELGHFVDLQYSITFLTSYAFENNHVDKNQYSEYFSFLAEPTLDVDKLRYHLGEYFCDLFAAQYVGNTIGLYLEYITNKSNKDSFTHPSTEKRVKVINDFLDKSENPIISLLQSVVKMMTKQELKVRFNEISSDDFYKLIPYEIKDDQELHGTIIYGWKVWLDDYKKFNEGMGYDVNLSEATIYRVINSLVEKTIGNYFTIQNWASHKI